MAKMQVPDVRCMPPELRGWEIYISATYSDGRGLEMSESQELCRSAPHPPIMRPTMSASCAWQQLREARHPTWAPQTPS